MNMEVRSGIIDELLSQIVELAMVLALTLGTGNGVLEMVMGTGNGHGYWK